MRGCSGSEAGSYLFKAHRLLYHSTLGLRVIKKKKMRGWGNLEGQVPLLLGDHHPERQLLPVHHLLPALRITLDYLLFIIYYLLCIFIDLGIGV